MKLILMTTALILTGVSAQATELKCFVAGQNPQNENDFNKLIKAIPQVEITKANPTAVLYAGSEFQIFVSIASAEKLAVSTFVMPGMKRSAAAVGGAESVQLIDGSLKVSVLCEKK